MEEEHQAAVKKMEEEHQAAVKKMQEMEEEHQAAVKKMEEEHQAAVKKMQESEEERQALRSVRISELKQAFEASGRKQNFAEPDEAETLLTLTEKKIIQQCRRPHCHGCKLGWICPKFWSE